MYGSYWSSLPPISHGEHTAAIAWEARVRDGQIVVTPVRGGAELGIEPQHPPEAGVWPRTEERARAFDWVMRGHKGAPPDFVTRTYCAWRRDNGLVAGTLPKYALAFLASLGCQ